MHFDSLYMQPYHSSGTKITIGIVNVEAFTMKLTEAYQVYVSTPKSTPILPRSDGGSRPGQTYFTDKTNKVSISLSKASGPVYMSVRQGLTNGNYIFTNAYNLATIRGVCEQVMKLPITDSSYSLVEVRKGNTQLGMVEMIKNVGKGDLLIQKRNFVG